ncbi:DUF4184 family protein [Pontibacter harenae]|uniref:DUF4184 family protein n=1 Tax=Pontibacter harenae TaxID=2894083 RepID=UPI001E313E4D|nr:DUF4184 family protein [Pontibacter harenae]MCC9167710.1 DUF4184 family protein [Pontibacter harenae]
MPFTFSHPAIVLPFKYFPERWRSMTGLIVGSMAPDFEKFIRMSTYDAYSHTWKSIFYFNLPIGLLLAFLFHVFVRDELIDHLPLFLQRRLIQFKGLNWVGYFRKNYGIVILSILIGTVSHIGWDAFTHIDGRFVRLFPILEKELVFKSFKMEMFNFLQNGSSLVGLLVIFIAFFMLPALPVPKPKTSQFRKLSYWVVFLLIAFSVLVLRYKLGDSLNYVVSLIIVSISASLISLVITSMLFRRS